MGFKITPNVSVMCFPYSVERRVTTERAAPATLSHPKSHHQRDMGKKSARASFKVLGCPYE